VAKLDGLVVAVELGDSPAAATTNGSGEGTFDLDDEVLLFGQFGPKHTHIGNVEWNSNRR